MFPQNCGWEGFPVCKKGWACWTWPFSVAGYALRQRMPQEMRLISLDWARPVVRVTLVGSCV